MSAPTDTDGPSCHGHGHPDPPKVTSGRRGDIYLPDASADSAGGAGPMPNLRYGA